MNAPTQPTSSSGTTPIIAGFYGRKSNAVDTAEEVKSIAVQREEARKFAEAHEWVLDERFEWYDDGISGVCFDADRPGLQSLLQAVCSPAGSSKTERRRHRYRTRRNSSPSVGCGIRARSCTLPYFSRP